MKEDFKVNPIFVYYNGVNHYSGLMLNDSVTGRVYYNNL